MGRVLLSMICILLPISALSEGRRAAFVVGNAVYDHAPDLANPEADATLVGATLDDLGFAVTVVRNARRDRLTRAFASFLTENVEADVTLW